MVFLKLWLGDSPIQLIIFCSSNEGVFLHFYAVQINTLNGISTAHMMMYSKVFKLVQC